MENLTERLEKMTPLQRAIYALKETRARLDALEQRQVEPIAVIGMACRFPGGANDPRSYWRLLREGVDAVREIPHERWDVDAFYHPDPTTPGKTNNRWGGFIDGIDQFDNHFFGISDREAERIDPMHRLVLELTWEALEDAGLPPSLLRGTRTGVFVGLSHSEFGIIMAGDVAQADAFVNIGTAHCMAANRTSFAFDFRGPSLMLDSACSSALFSVHLACQSLRSGEANVAFAGGVNVILSPMATINLTKAGLSAAGGRVRAFDAGATGYVRSEGAGIVVLKLLSEAMRDKDPIYAVIRGATVNQNGYGTGLTVPNCQAQQRLLREAYARVKLSPGRVQYVEAQGIGTLLGDAVEARALGEVLSEGRPTGSCCAIGSVKSNLGHLEAASGIASLMKVALAMHYGELPPTIHFERPNPDIPFDRLPLKVQQKLEPWPDSDQPRLAGVSAFGWGGTNAHVILEQAPVSEATDSVVTDKDAAPCLLLLSARTQNALRDLAGLYARLVQDERGPAWRDVCYTAAARRDHHDCRLAVLADSAAVALRRLDACCAEQKPPGLFRGRKPFGRDVKVAFVYDGGLEFWRTVTVAALGQIPGMSAAFEDVDAILRRLAGRSLTDAVADDLTWNDPGRSLVAVAGLQLTLANWWRSVGITPHVVLGRGAGEPAAASAAGMLTPEEALRAAVSCAGGEGRKAFEGLARRDASLPYISALEGRTHNGRILDRAPWTAGVDRSVGLDAAVRELAERKVDVCLEIGPESLHSVLADGLARDSETRVTVSSLGRGGRPRDGLLEAIGAVYAAGADFVWSRIAPAHGRYVRVPTYPWQRQRLWAARPSWLTRSPAPPDLPDTSPLHPSSTSSEAQDRLASVDTTELPSPRPRPDLNTPYVPPRTELEEVLVRSWSEILGVEAIGIHDSFFELGGDSLKATILLNRLQGVLGKPVDAHTLFQIQTINDLAAHLQNQFSSADGRLSLPTGLESTQDVIQGGRATADVIPRLSRDAEAQQLLSRLDQLTDEEVESMLQESRPRSELFHE